MTTLHKIENIDELKNLPKEDFVLLTELNHLDHIKEKDRIHKLTCRILKKALEMMKNITLLIF